MVRIINYKEREKEDGTSFYVLELQGGIELVQSKETGNFYATAKKAYIPSTFDEQTCAALIGTEMPGGITKEECDAFDYVIKETGEEITLNHRWVYTSEETSSSQNKQAIKQESKPEIEMNLGLERFSQNGVLEHA